MDGLDLSVASSADPLAEFRRAPPRRPVRSWLRRHARLVGFLLAVVLPTLAAGVYLVGFAAFQYVSEARFVVRGPVAQAAGPLSGLLQTAGVSRAQDDAYAVQDYILSRDALSELVNKEGLRDVFSRPEADVLSRFPWPAWVPGAASFEHLFAYYLRHVDVLLDSSTGVTTLTVATFRPEDSQRIAQALLDAAERLVNRMNERQRDTAVRDARREVERAEARVEAVAAQVAQFRNREALLDPNKQSVPMLQSIHELQTMLSRVNLQISQLTVSSPHSPLIADYQRRAAALEGQINEAKAKITGADSSLVSKITAFDLLSLQREFADKQLASATSSLETARMQAERQALYLDPVVQPNLTDYALYPRRVAWLAVVFATLLGAYLLTALLVASAHEHRIR